MSAIQPKSCVICLADFPSDEEIKRLENLSFEGLKQVSKEDLTPTQTKCDHFFHYGCISNWINEFRKKEKETQQPNCPTCRHVLIEQSFASPNAAHAGFSMILLPTFLFNSNMAGIAALAVSVFLQNHLHAEDEVDRPHDPTQQFTYSMAQQPPPADRGE